MGNRFKYKILQITGVTDAEVSEWKEYADKKGYHTLSDALRHILAKFKECGYESTTGSNLVAISSFNGEIKVTEYNRRSRAIRKFINKQIKRGK